MSHAVPASPAAGAKAQIESALRDALADLSPQTPFDFSLERPKQSAHGDYASNLALMAGRAQKRNPREIAVSLSSRVVSQLQAVVEKVEVAGPGFLNFFLTPAARQAVVHHVLAQDERYGRSDARRGERIMVEFVSANPTGPLHVGHGRQAALGDAIANLLQWQGAQVTREFYYNDAGQQIENLALSVQARAREILGETVAFPDDGYRGEYVREIAQAWLDASGGSVADMDAIRRFAVSALRREQDRDLEAFGVRFDQHYLESSLYSDGRVERTVAALAASGHSYEAEGALWLRTTAFGDDKDRVMRRSNGGYTYFVPDVAYHVTKWERGFSKVINVQGSDHHSTVLRVRAGLQALDAGIPQGYPDYVLHKMVTVMRGGEEVRISKRAGSYVSVRDLIDEVGRDAVRFFLVSRKAEAEFTFDIDLARSQSEDNPVYYVQYAHARVMSVLKAAARTREAALREFAHVDLSPLCSPYEDVLLRRVADFPDEIAAAARDLAPHQITHYLKSLAGEFHSYYNAERFLVEDRAVRAARLALVVAVGIVLANGLAVLGISAPEAM